MLVQLKRSFFGPGGVHYDTSTGVTVFEFPNDYYVPKKNDDFPREKPDDWSDERWDEERAKRLPRDAVILSKDGTLPSPAVKPKAGFQAKPEHLQVLDQIPGASPDGQIHPTDGGTSAVKVDKDDMKQGLKAAKEMEDDLAEASGDKGRKSNIKL